MGLVLAAAGGYLDAYTYLCRGGVFANAETGNMVLLGAKLAVGDWAAAVKYLPPILAFFLGVLAAEAIRRRGKAAPAQKLHWRQRVLALEITVLAAAAFAPLGGGWDMAVNWAVSFVCALQVESFRRVADACHAYGAKVSIQLQHAGPEGNSKLTGYPLKAASAIAPSAGREIPEAMPTE